MANRAEFVRPPTRTSENPFTGAPWQIAPAEGEVTVLIGGVPSGAISPSDDFESTGELEVWSPPEHLDHIHQVAFEVALGLNAELVWCP